MGREDRIKLVEGIRSTLAKTDALIFVDISGMKVSEMNALRADVRRSGGRVKVYKRRLALKALDDLGVRNVEGKLDGATGYCLPGADVVACAKAVVSFRSKRPDFKIKGGMSAGKALESTEISEWARLPGVDVLRARVVGNMAGPLYGFAWTLSSMLGGLVRVLDARKQALENAS